MEFDIGMKVSFNLNDSHYDGVIYDIIEESREAWIETPSSIIKIKLCDLNICNI